MSRSYRKNLIWTQLQTRNSWAGPRAKRHANKKIRKYKGYIPNGMAYKKLYCSWNICDWRFSHDPEKYPEMTYKIRCK